MKLTVLAVAGAAFLVSACGGSHAVCKDEASSRQYFEKSMAEMQANAGTIPPEKFGEMQSDMTAIAEAGASGDWGSACTKIDDMRKKFGI